MVLRCGSSGAAQIDRYGNLNTTAIFDKGDYYKPKALAWKRWRNDIGSSVGRVVIMMKLERPVSLKGGLLTTPGFLDGTPGARERAGLLGNGPSAVVADKAFSTLIQQQERCIWIPFIPE